MRNRILAWRHFLPQSYWVAGGGGRVTRLVAFERLDEEMEEIAAAIGAAYLPRRLNSSRRADYRSYYDDRGAEQIGRLYAADVSLTGAAFDDGRRLGVTAPPRAQARTRLA